MNLETLLEDAFLTLHYEDTRGGLETWNIYGSDGRVHVFDTQHWRVDYRLTAEEITQVQAALARCGLYTAQDMGAGDIHDTATYTWTWALPDGRAGELQNRAYPAKTHPVMDCILAALDKIAARHVAQDETG